MPCPPLRLWAGRRRLADLEEDHVVEGPRESEESKDASFREKKDTFIVVGDDSGEVRTVSINRIEVPPEQRGRNYGVGNIVLSKTSSRMAILYHRYDQSLPIVNIFLADDNGKFRFEYSLGKGNNMCVKSMHFAYDNNDEYIVLNFGRDKGFVYWKLDDEENSKTTTMQTAGIGDIHRWMLPGLPRYSPKSQRYLEHIWTPGECGGVRLEGKLLLMSLRDPTLI